MRVQKGLKKIYKGMSGYNREKLKAANFKKRGAKKKAKKETPDVRDTD